MDESTVASGIMRMLPSKSLKMMTGTRTKQSWNNSPWSITPISSSYWLMPGTLTKNFLSWNMLTEDPFIKVHAQLAIHIFLHFDQCNVTYRGFPRAV